MSPLPNACGVTTAEGFWENAAHVYDDRIDYVFGNDMRKIFLETLKKESPLGQTVECGCGSGYCTPVLAGLSEHVVATDIAEEMLYLTRERMRGYPIVTVKKENCERTTFPPGSFDTAFIGLAFHMIDGRTTLSEMHRILRPGGRLILTIPTMEDLGLVTLINTVWRNRKVFGRFKQPGTVLYTRQSLHDLITPGGFSVQVMHLLRDLDNPGGLHGLYVRAVKE